MMKKIFATAMLVAFAAAPLAFAHTGPGDQKDIPGPNPNCWKLQNPHDYGAPGSLEFDVVGSGGGVGVAGASDYSTVDCKGDGGDGDPEYGTGGGFFPAGPWATVCGYNPHHTDNVHVHDAVWQPNDGTGLHESVSFTVGADPSDPTIVTVPDIVILDPDGVPESGDEIVIEGGTDCVDDGCICQGGDLDPDDWLKTCLHKCPIFPAPPGKEDNPRYGEPGGDGGYWVFINCNGATDGDVSLGLEDKDGDTVPDNANPSVTPPTSAGGACSSTGHIYFPNEWPGKVA